MKKSIIKDMKKSHIGELRQSPLLEVRLFADFSSDAVFSEKSLRTFLLDQRLSKKPFRLVQHRDLQLTIEGVGSRYVPSAEKSISGVLIDLDARGLRRLELKSSRFAFVARGRYRNWDEFCAQSLPYLMAYVAFRQAKIERLGVLSINDLSIMRNERVADVFEATGVHASELGRSFDMDLFSRDTRYYPEHETFVSTVRRFRNSLKSSVNKLRYSIEAFRFYPDAGLPLQQISKDLDRIRRVKDFVFFGELADKHLERYR